MAEEMESTRPKSRRGQRKVARQAVLAEVRRDDDPGDDGSAGVREPRRPKPKGPVSGAGERPEPQPPLAAVLPDPRY